MHKKIKVIGLLFLSIVSFLQAHTAFADTPSCVANAMRSAKDAGSNQRALKNLYIVYFGDALARRSVARDWPRMSQGDRTAQVEYATSVVMSVASRFAAYANATFVWRDATHAVVTLNGQSAQVTVYPAGIGCQMSDICIAGKPCLSSLIGDYRKLISKK